MTDKRSPVLHASDLTPDLIELWKDFCRSDPIYRSPFYWPQFTMAVARIRADVRIAVIEDREGVQGFLPFHLTRSGAGKPIGGQLNDYQGPILARGYRISPSTLLSEADIASYDYNHLPTHFAELATDAHTFSVSPQMDLSDGFDALIARRGQTLIKARKDIERCSRKSEREIGALRFEFSDSDDEAFRRHLAMKNAQLESIGAGLRIGSDWLGKILEELRQCEEEEFASVFSTLHAGDRLLAAHFGLRSREVLHWWIPSYDLAARNIGPGINLLDHCAKAANANGISTIDFGRGAGAYKLKFADTQVELCEGSVTRPGSLAKFVRRGTHSLVSAAERLPLGRYKTYPRRAAARFVSGVALSGNEYSTTDRVAP